LGIVVRSTGAGSGNTLIILGTTSLLHAPCPMPSQDLEGESMSGSREQEVACC